MHNIRIIKLYSNKLIEQPVHDFSMEIGLLFVI